MSKSIFVPGVLALALLSSPIARAVSDADLADIRDQIRQMKESYEARIQALNDTLSQRAVELEATNRDALGGAHREEIRRCQ